MRAYVFDASALFVFLQGKPGAAQVGALLKEALRERANIFMSTVNYGEVYGVILRLHGMEQAAASMSAVHALPIQLTDATSQRALRAAELKFRFRLYYADSFAAALAAEHKATLITSDSDFRKLGHGWRVVWLKTSRN